MLKPLRKATDRVEAPHDGALEDQVPGGANVHVAVAGARPLRTEGADPAGRLWQLPAQGSVSEPGQVRSGSISGRLDLVRL